MTSFEVYLWLSLDKISNMLIIVPLGILGCYYGGKIFIASCNNDYIPKFNNKILFISIFIFIGILMPSTKDCAIIYVLPKIVNSEISQRISKDAPEIYDMAVQRLKNMVAEPVIKQSLGE